MGEAIEEIDRDIGKPLQWHTSRLDLARNTAILAQRNVNKDVYVTLGKNQVTMILHPHAARRLMKAIEAVLDGKEYDRG